MTVCRHAKNITSRSEQSDNTLGPIIHRTRVADFSMEMALRPEVH